MLSHEQAQELTRLIRRFQSVLDEIHAWPADDEEYRALLLELRELHRVLDEKLPPATETLP